MLRQGGTSMAVDAVLKFDLRKKSKAENIRLMKNGYLLGSIYGKGIEAVSIVIKKDEFKKTFKHYGRNCVLQLVNQDQLSYEVMVKDIQTNPKNYDYYHVDFQRVVFTDNIKAEVPVKYSGSEFLQAKRLVLNRLIDVIPVSGLPQDIPHVIEFDLSNLNAGDNILVSDLKFGEGIRPEIDDNQLIASIIGV